MAVIQTEDMQIIIASQVHMRDRSCVTEQVKQSVLHSYPEPQSFLSDHSPVSSLFHHGMEIYSQMKNCVWQKRQEIQNCFDLILDNQDKITSSLVGDMVVTYSLKYIWSF